MPKLVQVGKMDKFNLITYGWGGFLAQTTRLLTITLKRLSSKLGDFLFLSIRHILAEFLQNRFTKGVASVVVEMRHLKKLSIRIYFVSLQYHRNAKEGARKDVFRHKKWFFWSFARFYEVNIESRWLVPFWKGNFCDVISLKEEKPITLNFACLLVSWVPLLVPNFK